MRIYTMDLEGFNKTAEIRRQYFAKHFPATTLIVVEGLDEPGTLIEVEAIAVVG